MKIGMRAGLLIALTAISGLSVPAQTPATGRVMREKLTHSQKVLEAIMTSNFALLERESVELAKVVESPAWSVFNGPEYARQSAAFLRATQDLEDAAKAHDLDAATMHYVSLTLSCFQCHRYMKNARIAKPR
jgi:hypothetical protein